MATAAVPLAVTKTAATANRTAETEWTVGAAAAAAIETTDSIRCPDASAVTADGSAAEGPIHPEDSETEELDTA